RAEGRDEPIRIEYPVGSYSPHFVRHTPPPEPASAIPARETMQLKQVAVLPFISVSGEDSEAFSDGLTDELIHALSSWPSLRVIARSSCFQFKGKSEDVRRIGEW